MADTENTENTETKKTFTQAQQVKAWKAVLKAQAPIDAAREALAAAEAEAQKTLDENYEAASSAGSVMVDGNEVSIVKRNGSCFVRTRKPKEKQLVIK